MVDEEGVQVDRAANHRSELDRVRATFHQGTVKICVLESEPDEFVTVRVT
jgi:hypothetical protein